MTGKAATILVPIAILCLPLNLNEFSLTISLIRSSRLDVGENGVD